MSETDHFIIFQRTSGHCANWLVRAANLREATIRCILEEGCRAEVRPDGTVEYDDGWGGRITYGHPVACIESEDKTLINGDRCWGWEIRRLQQAQSDAPFAEAFCSENPYDLEEHFAYCRPLLRKLYPRSRAKAFLWYLKKGPLVTFYRLAHPRRRRPVVVLARYFAAWDDWLAFTEWNGTHDDILDQIKLDYPW